MDTFQIIPLIRETLTEGFKWMKPKPHILVWENEFHDGVKVLVASDYFAGIYQHKREELVWEVLDRALPWDIIKLVTTLFVLTRGQAKNLLTSLEPTTDPFSLYTSNNRM
jgi:hypothetical protein